jgi:hypothetical protein
LTNKKHFVYLHKLKQTIMARYYDIIIEKVYNKEDLLQNNYVCNSNPIYSSVNIIILGKNNFIL